MRAMPTLLRPVVAAAAVLLLAGCGSGGNEEPSSAAGAGGTATSAPGTDPDAPEADSEFCTGAATLIDDLQTVFTRSEDPISAGDALQEAADRMRELDPPQEIAADWHTLAGGLEQYATAFADLDYTDTESVRQFEEATAPLEAQLTEASTKVENYLSDQCGIETSGTGSSPAPPS